MEDFRHPTALQFSVRHILHGPMPHATNLGLDSKMKNYSVEIIKLIEEKLLYSECNLIIFVLYLYQ